MSGGSFNYAYRRVETFVEELEAKLRRSTAPHEDASDDEGEGERVPEMSPETLAKLTEIAKLGDHFAKLMREAELLYSGDTSEDSFHVSLAELATSRPEFHGAPVAAP